MRRCAPLLLLLLACSKHPVEPARLVTTEFDLDFGAVFVEETLEQTITLEARGDGSTPLVLDPASLPPGFSVELGTAPLRGGEQRPMAIDFKPTELGPRSGTLSIKTPGLTTPIVHVQVQGTGIRQGIGTDPDVLDFGMVLVGTSKALPLVVTNRINSDQHIDISSDDPAFTVNPPSLDMGPERATTVQVTFSPTSRGSFDGPHLRFNLCQTCAMVPMDVQATGAVTSLALTPDFIDFGARSVGFRSCQTVNVKNDGDLTLSFDSIHADDRFLADGFSLDAGSLASPIAILPPGTSGDIRICFTPAEHGHAYKGHVFMDSNALHTSLEVRGDGDPEGLAVIPSSIDFGTTTTTSPVTRQLVIENAGSPAPFQLVSVDLDQPDDAFGLAFPDGSPRGFAVGQGDYHVTAVFGPAAAGDHARSIVVRALRPEGFEESVSIPVSGTGLDGAPCTLAVSQSQVRFGLVLAGGHYVRALRIDNLGAESCTVWGFSLSPSDVFRMTGAPRQVSAIAPGASLDLTLSYDPPAPGVDLDEATLHFGRITETGTDPVMTIPVSGFPSALDVAAEPADFGTVPVGGTKWMAVNVVNRSGKLVKAGAYGSPMNAAGDIALSASTPGAFHLFDLPSYMPATIAAGRQLTFSASFSPSAAGPASGEIEVWLLHTVAPVIVPVSGTGSTGPCGTFCSGTTALCPGPSGAFVHELVTLQGASEGDGSPCGWQIASAPSGSTASLDAADTCRPGFRADLEGDYSFRLASGGSTCTTTLHATTYAGLWIETTWSAPDDLDLHLLHPLAGDPLSARAWFDIPYDCTFDNQSPYWDTQGHGDDPVLVRDDEVGQGPEEIRIDEPSTSHPYNIGVHWFSSKNHNPSELATTRVYCGGTEQFSRAVSLDRVYTGADVGSVTWNGDGTCSFEVGRGSVIVIP